MIQLGQTLKSAREAKGLTAAEVADKTHLMTAMIEDLEREDFSKIVAPIYGRGYIKLYCRVVDLDPEPLTEAFTALYKGEKSPVVEEKERLAKIEETQKTEKVEEPPLPAPVAAEPPKIEISEIDLFNQQPEPEPQRVDETQPMHEKFEPVQEKTAIPSYSRYSAPVREERIGFQLNPLIWRWAILAIVAILAIWVIISIVGALHSATTEPVEKVKAAEELITENKSAAPEQKAPRTPVEVAPLYID